MDSADRLIFSRFTQLGFLRLLTNTRAIERALTTSRAWSVYDEWLSDPRVEFHDEPQSLHSAFRQATAPFSDQPATKWIGDCYLLAFARQANATLVTFDQALHKLGAARGYVVTVPQ